MLTCNPAVFYDDTGLVNFTVSDDTLELQNSAHLTKLNVSPEEFALLVPGKTFVIAGMLRTQPDQPSMSHYWDVSTFSWKVDLTHAKRQANFDITLARNKEETEGFSAFGKLFDSDAVAIQRISLEVQAAQAVGETFEVTWTCKDNSTILLDYWMVQALPAVMANAANTLHVKARSLKAQIELASTLEELVLITW